MRTTQSRPLFNQMVGIIMTVFSLYIPLNAVAGDTEADVTSGEELPQIVVTAQKETQDAKDVPISMTVLTEQQILDRQLKSVKDLGAVTPNLMMFENGVSGMMSPSFRGLSSDIEARTVPSGMYIDGVPVLSGIGFDEPLMDIERVEVLKGPQGTLYGKNTEAGVINIITRQPDNQARFTSSIELGEDNKREYAISAATPIVKDKLYLGVSGRHYQKDGYVTNLSTGKTVDDRENEYGKIVLRFTPNPDLDISLIASRLEYDDGAATLNYAGVTEPEVDSNLDGYNRSVSSMSVLKISWDLSEKSSLESISSYRNYDLDTAQDWDFSQTTGYHVYRTGDNTTLSQELKFHSAVGTRFTYTTGLYLEKTDDQMRVSTNMYDINTDFTSQSIGVFGHGTYRLTDEFSLIGGLRFDSDTAQITNTDDGIDQESSFDALSPKLAVQYKINPNTMTWISATKGYRSGGYSTFIVNGEAHPFDQEELWSYEVGVKKNWGRIGINASVYYMDIDDMQVQEPLGADMEITTNAAQAHAAGAEMEVTARITQTLSLFGGAGYNHIRFDTFSDTNGDYAGNTVPFAPKYNFNVGCSYRNAMGIYARLECRGYGEIYFDKANNYKRSAFALVNAKVGYETEHVDLYLYAKNLFDETYNSDGYYNGYYTIYSPPREIGIQTVFHF